MIANSYNEFVEKASDAIRVALNNEFGQELTKNLLDNALKENPNMTKDEWNKMKSEFMTFIFAKFVMSNKDAMEELSNHVYDELRNHA